MPDIGHRLIEIAQLLMGILLKWHPSPLTGFFRIAQPNVVGSILRINKEEAWTLTGHRFD